MKSKTILTIVSVIIALTVVLIKFSRRTGFSASDLKRGSSSSYVEINFDNGQKVMVPFENDRIDLGTYLAPVMGSSKKETKTLPLGIGELANMETVILKDNKLEKINDEIGKLTKLKTLDFSNNNISLLPDELCNLKELKTLRLTGNPVGPEEIEKIKSCLPECNIEF